MMIKIKDYENYSIDELGNITNTNTGKLLKPNNRKGYLYISLNKKNKTKHTALHRLLYQAFKGKLLPDMVIDHIDNNTLNNSLDNLQQITQRENSSKDKYRYSNTSNYIGVYKETNRKGYRAEITFAKKQYVIGSFNTELDAHKAYQDVLSNFNHINNYKQIKTKSTPYKGVYYDKQRNNYRAEITVNKIRYRIGRHNTPEQAIFAIRQYTTLNNIPYTK